MDFSLTDEQRDFVAAIRDFCARECGTPEQRERLTSEHTEAHSAEIYSRMAATKSRCSSVRLNSTGGGV